MRVPSYRQSRAPRTRDSAESQVRPVISNVEGRHGEVGDVVSSTRTQRTLRTGTAPMIPPRRTRTNLNTDMRDTFSNSGTDGPVLAPSRGAVTNMPPAPRVAVT